MSSWRGIIIIMFSVFKRNIIARESRIFFFLQRLSLFIGEINVVPSSCPVRARVELAPEALAVFANRLRFQAEPEIIYDRIPRWRSNDFVTRVTHF